ncbi:unnamed protein product [Polarella glacialis]|nr:unnamed protein product [Polarella glacialis]
MAASGSRLAAAKAAQGRRQRDFPEAWLKKFTRAELEASEAEAGKWRKMTRAAAQHAWKGYKDTAWGSDEVQPVTGGPGRTWADCGLQILDALDTLWLMGLEREFEDGARWVEESLAFDHVAQTMSVFEMTIRAVGGLNAAHSLSGRPIFLQKAEELAARMLPAFTRHPGYPTKSVDLKHRARGPRSEHTTVADAGTLQLEFRYVSQQTGNQTYARAADRSMRAVEAAGMGKPLIPSELDVNGLLPSAIPWSSITVGPPADSFYEYLLKVYLQTGKTEPEWKDAWISAMEQMLKQLTIKSDAGLMFVTGIASGILEKQVSTLSCFVGGMLMYGSRQLRPEEVDPEWAVAAELITESCYQTYHREPSHLGPETFFVIQNGIEGQNLEASNSAYILRPETAESIFYMFYYTGDPKYRRMAGEIIEAIDRNCKTRFGFSAVEDVTMASPYKTGSMETFFMAETLKYLYLTFVPSPQEVLDLDEFVLNTEAHPIRIVRP